jgi:hypothetical protein
MQLPVKEKLTTEPRLLGYALAGSRNQDRQSAAFSIADFACLFGFCF